MTRRIAQWICNDRGQKFRKELISNGTNTYRNKTKKGYESHHYLHEVARLKDKNSKRINSGMRVLWTDQNEEFLS